MRILEISEKHLLNNDRNSLGSCSFLYYFAKHVCSVLKNGDNHYHKRQCCCWQAVGSDQSI